MTDKSRFISDRRTRRDTSWSDPEDWEAGEAENVGIVDGGLVSERPNQELVEGQGAEAPQKLIHRWTLSEESGPFSDHIGGADGANIGTARAVGEWSGGAARRGDGRAHIETTAWGNFGIQRDEPLAIAFTISDYTGDGRDHVVGVSNDSGFEDGWIGLRSGHTAPGEIDCAIANDGGAGPLRATTKGGIVNDGGTYRVVFNSFGVGLHPEVWIDQVNETEVSNTGRGSFSQNFQYPVSFFGRNVAGSIAERWDGIIDDICVYGDSLTASEIESYNHPWL